MMKIIAIIIKEVLVITPGHWAARDELARQDGSVPHTDLLLLPQLLSTTKKDAFMYQ